MVLMVSMSNYTVLTQGYENQWYDFNKELRKPDPCENWGSYHNARATSNVGNLSSKLVPLKWDLILTKWICGLIHKFSRSINVFSTTFYLSLLAFRRFSYNYICFDPNYRTAEVASIQMLLAQWIWDMAYFRHYNYCDHLLFIIKICNLEETVVMRDQWVWL